MKNVLDELNSWVTEERTSELQDRSNEFTQYERKHKLTDPQDL